MLTNYTYEELWFYCSNMITIEVTVYENEILNIDCLVVNLELRDNLYLHFYHRSKK